MNYIIGATSKMPSRMVHMLGGIIIGIPIVGVVYYFFSEEMNYFLFSGVLAVSLVLISFGSLLPDIIERPTNPEHRKFFHSWFIFSISFIAIFITCFVIIPRYTQVFLIYPLLVFFLGYFSHLLLDSTTKRSLT